MWAYNSVFYQIYPVGFCGAPYANDGICVSRILKIGEWADYLKELGVDAIMATTPETSVQLTVVSARIKILQMSAGYCTNTISVLYWMAYSIM